MCFAAAQHFQALAINEFATVFSVSLELNRLPHRNVTAESKHAALGSLKEAEQRRGP